MPNRASEKLGTCCSSPGTGRGGGETFLQPAAPQWAEHGSGSSPLPIATLPGDPGLIALHFAAPFSSLETLRNVLINTYTASATKPLNKQIWKRNTKNTGICLDC